MSGYNKYIVYMQTWNETQYKAVKEAFTYELDKNEHNSPRY